MPPRKRPRPIGRKGHVEQVAKVETGLNAMLRAIAADPTAGPWGKWAERMLKGDGPTRK